MRLFEVDSVEVGGGSRSGCRGRHMSGPFAGRRNVRELTYQEPKRRAGGAAAMGAKVLERFPAGAPRGSWPAEEYAAARRAEGEPAQVVMDLKSDAFLVVVPARDEE